MHLLVDSSGLQIKIHHPTERFHSHHLCQHNCWRRSFSSLYNTSSSWPSLTTAPPPPPLSRQCTRDSAVFCSIFLHHGPSTCTPPVHDALFYPLPPQLGSCRGAGLVSSLAQKSRIVCISVRLATTTIICEPRNGRCLGAPRLPEKHFSVQETIRIILLRRRRRSTPPPPPSPPKQISRKTTIVKKYSTMTPNHQPRAFIEHTAVFQSLSRPPPTMAPHPVASYC